MKIYEILITETLTRVVEVEAETSEEALTMLNDKYVNQEIVLTGDDYEETKMEIIHENNYNIE
jgi:ATP:corrinoid adenosyltransferase